MSRYDLFQPQLSRLPVCVVHANRLDPATMSFPVAESAGEREAVYLNESVFRAGPQGVEDAVTAIAKVQQHAHELAAVERNPLATAVPILRRTLVAGRVGV